ncbi:unnamed protein product [Triticum turgidum subsp. durum]|nr:unnamed protein product [Triticum turgidum subsp. durum]
MSAIAEDYPLLIQVYSKGSPRCAQFFEYWKQIDTRLDGVANTAMVELGDVPLAGYFAEKRFSQQPFFRNGIPALVAYPANCRNPSCYMRYPGELTVDSVVNWVASSIVGLPRILYYSKETLIDFYLRGTAPLMQSLYHFRDPSSLGRVAIIRSRLSFSQALGSVRLHSFAKLPKSIPAMHPLHLSYGKKRNPRSGGIRTFSKSEFTEIMEEHKHQELQQLRSDTSLDLGCDARGHSRAGKEMMIWYCVIAAGRPGVELSKKRQILRKAQDQLLSAAGGSTAGNLENLVEVTSAATALKDDRLTFVWLDGELQKKICAFYLATDYNGACGPRGFEDDNDKPEVFIVRFQRNATYEALKADKKNNLIETLQGQDTPDASQLVARYNGPDEILEINKWVSQIIKDGDTREIPYFTSKVPDLVPEETNKEWLSGTKGIRSAGKSLKERVQNSGFSFRDYLTDPRIGPALLMLACISWGTIWFKNIQSAQKTPKDEAPKDKTDKRRRPKLSTTLFGQPESSADPEPRDARQWEIEDSDSD